MINLPTDFVPGHRHFFVYGTRSADAVFQVYVDGESIASPSADSKQFDPCHPNLGSVQYAFNTETCRFGTVPIRIEMQQGSLSLTQTRVYYPAKITNSEGIDSFAHYGLFQPIGDPKWAVKINGVQQALEQQDQHLTGEVHYGITAGDILEYLHAMIDGPNYWWINYKTSTPAQIIDQFDNNINFALFDNYDRLNTLKISSHS